MPSRLRRALRAPRRLQFTTEGRWFVFMTIAVGAGAINTANNLLYLLLGMMLGLVVLSGVLSEWMLRGMLVKRIAPGNLFAGQPAVLSWELRNTKRVVPSLSIEVAEHESRATRSRRRTAIGLAPEPRRKRFGAGVVDDGDPGGPKGLALRVPAGGKAWATGEVTFPTRGLQRYVGIDVVTRFPFNFFEKTRPIEDPHELLVLPAIDLDRAASVQVASLQGEIMRRTEGRGGEFFGLREFREGDDRRDIHWKASARRSAPVRRLYEREENEAVSVYLHDHLPASLEGEALREAEAEMEDAIRLAASLCAWYIDAGWRVGLHTIDGHVHESIGAGQLHAQLRHLALLEVRRDEEPPELRGVDVPGALMVATRFTPPEVRGAATRVVEAREGGDAAPPSGGDNPSREAA
ncbi:MAG: DUF58 domain-containing protein [Deltaproteobacteria bacterium]|nr:MAG: DUF58 domain-containing protein [Deltaproteobacteria bacterium]